MVTCVKNVKCCVSYIISKLLQQIVPLKDTIACLCFLVNTEPFSRYCSVAAHLDPLQVRNQLCFYILPLFLFKKVCFHVFFIRIIRILSFVVIEIDERRSIMDQPTRITTPLRLQEDDDFYYVQIGLLWSKLVCRPLWVVSSCVLSPWLSMGWGRCYFLVLVTLKDVGRGVRCVWVAVSFRRHRGTQAR